MRACHLTSGLLGKKRGYGNFPKIFRGSPHGCPILGQSWPVRIKSSCLAAFARGPFRSFGEMDSWRFEAPPPDPAGWGREARFPISTAEGFKKFPRGHIRGSRRRLPGHDFPCAGNRHPLRQCRSLSDPVTGTEIKLWRRLNGRSRIWLAQRCGVSSRTVEAWEQEVRNPSGPALLLLEGLMTRTKK